MAGELVSTLVVPDTLEAVVCGEPRTVGRSSWVCDKAPHPGAPTDYGHNIPWEEAQTWQGAVDAVQAHIGRHRELGTVETWAYALGGAR